MSLGDNWVVTANSQVNQGKIIDGLSVKIDRSGDENEIVIRGETVSKGYHNTTELICYTVTIDTTTWGIFEPGISENSPKIHHHSHLRSIIQSNQNWWRKRLVRGSRKNCREAQLVQESVVYGVPDDVWGEIVACAVRLEPDVEWERMTENVNNPDAWAFMKYAEERKDSSRIVNEDLLRLWCLKKQLARFKVPKQWVFFKDDFPRNSGDKVDLSKLRKQSR